jgi:hypothetical protein
MFCGFLLTFEENGGILLLDSQNGEVICICCFENFYQPVLMFLRHTNMPHWAGEEFKKPDGNIPTAALRASAVRIKFAPRHKKGAWS